MMVPLTTFSDIVEHGFDYLSGNPSEDARRDIIRSAQAAARDIANAHTWSYLYAQGRIFTSAAWLGDGDATVGYLHDGGTYPRQLTLAGDIWPDWAADGFVTIGDETFRVTDRISATIVALDPVLNPGRDIDAGTSFSLSRDTYLLPEDYIAQDQSLYEGNFGGMTYRHPRECLFHLSSCNDTGTPRFYTITGSPRHLGRLVMKIWPSPDASRTIDFVYKRRPGALSVVAESSGSVSTEAGSTAIAGSLTAFTPWMVGSSIRIAREGTLPPTDIAGDRPAYYESTVVSRPTATSIVVADPLPETLAGLAYVISDVIDIEPGSMLNAYWRCFEKHLAIARTLKDKPNTDPAYRSALAEAKSADSRSFAGRYSGQGAGRRMRLSDHPYTFDIH